MVAQAHISQQHSVYTQTAFPRSGNLSLESAQCVGENNGWDDSEGNRYEDENEDEDDMDRDHRDYDFKFENPAEEYDCIGVCVSLSVVAYGYVGEDAKNGADYDGVDERGDGDGRCGDGGCDPAGEDEGDADDGC